MMFLYRLLDSSDTLIIETGETGDSTASNPATHVMDRVTLSPCAREAGTIAKLTRQQKIRSPYEALKLFVKFFLVTFRNNVKPDRHFSENRLRRNIYLIEFKE